MVDKACPDETEDKMKKVILAQNGVQQVDMLKTRLFGSKIYVDSGDFHGRFQASGGNTPDRRGGTQRH